MKNHDHYLDFFDYMERAPLTPKEIYGERHPFSSPSESVSNDKTLSFTDPGLDRNPSLPLDALNKLLTFYCYLPNKISLTYIMSTSKPSASLRKTLRKLRKTAQRHGFPTFPKNRNRTFSTHLSGKYLHIKIICPLSQNGPGDRCFYPKDRFTC